MAARKVSEAKRKADRAYYVANRERILARVAQYQADHADDLRVYHAEYRKRNRARLSASDAASYQRNKVERNAQARSWHAANRDKVREYKKRRRVERPDIIKAARLRDYGLTVAQFDAMNLAQDNRCAICSIEFRAEKLKGPHVDHCHVSGVVRQLLCRRCNSLLGYVKDDPQILLAAVEYLLAHEREVSNHRI